MCQKKLIKLSLVCLLMALITSVKAVSDQSNAHVWLQQAMTLADARHLTGRTGIGTSAQELSALVGLSRSDAIDRVAGGLKKTPYIPMPSWVDEPAPRFWTRGASTRDAQLAFDRERDAEISELRQWWVNNMVQTNSAQTERLVMFWHDHFATSYNGIGQRSISMARQNKTFRSLGTGSYRTLLKAMIRDPALLMYLDNNSNRKGRPNENLARELLELFTLGEGNFDEPTVKEAARALTGYGISETHNHSFRFYSYKHDKKDKTLFGVTANYNGDALIDIILEQPAAAEHLVKKFWAAYVADHKPDEEFVLTLANTFRESDYDLLKLYKSVLQSRQFWDESNRLSLIKSPMTLLIGTARSLDYPKRAWSQLPSLHALLGMELFAPPNVSGWKEGAAFVAPGRLLNRQLALQTLLSTSTASLVGDANAMMSMQSNSMSKESESPIVSSDMNMMQPEPATAPMQVRLAGHLFNGAPKFQVSLYQDGKGNDTQLWRSEERTLTMGYDTKVFGAMQEQGVLTWVTESYHPQAAQLDKATRVEIEFLNDAASKLGDRNLFVESVEINDRIFSTADATQVSDCIPKDSKAAGDLYCAGTVSIDLSALTTAAFKRNNAFTATGASVIWTRERVGNPRLDAIIALENVQTPDQFFHTLSFHLFSPDDESLELRLDAYGCWPDCINQWPECAWNEGTSDEKMIVFPLRRGRDENIDCHYESLSVTDKSMVNALWKSIPSVLAHVADSDTRGRNVSNLQSWGKRIVALDEHIKNNVYVETANMIVINPDYVVPFVATRFLPEPEILINDLTQLQQSVKSRDLSLTDLLIGGADIEYTSELSVNNEQPIEVQLENLLAHPVFQVY